MNYTLHQLQVFLQVVEYKSITRAAETLHLTQPAVSIQLKNLQDQFDIPLTEIVGRQLFVTDFGREIAQAARLIVEQAQAIQQKTMAYKGQLTGRLKIAVVSTGKYIMPYFLTDFFQRHPGVEVVMDVTNKSRVIESMQQNEVDFSLVSILPERLSVVEMALLQNKLFLVASTQIKIPRSQSAYSIFEQLPLIYREPGSATRQSMERFLLQLKIPVSRKMELTSNEAVKQAVMAGLGVSIMPLIGIKNELTLGQLQIIPIKELPIQTTWRLIWLKGKQASPAAKAFLEFLQAEREHIVQKHFDWYEAY